jgi:GntR family transcriptional regulator
MKPAQTDWNGGRVVSERPDRHEEFLDEVVGYGFSTSSTSSIPLYYQLYLILQRGIRDQRLEPGDRFPSEEAIAARFRVSRPTANRAVQELINRGWVMRRRGRGTFVEQTRPTQLALLNASLSFSDEIGKREDHRTQFIRRSEGAATVEDAEALNLKPGAPVVYFRRVHAIGERVVMVCDSKLPAERFPNIVKAKLTEGSLFKTLEIVYGCRVERADRCVEAAEILDAEVAELLQVPQFAPVILMTGMAFDGDLNPVEAMTAFVREGVAFRNIIHADQVPVGPQRKACPRTHPPTTGEAC